MPKKRADAHPSVPDAETLEALLETPGLCVKKRALHELTDEEKARIRLVNPGYRKSHIEGDPEGIWNKWAGNLAHPLDQRMTFLLQPLCDHLIGIRPTNSPEIAAITSLLVELNYNNIKTVAKNHANADGFDIIADTSEEVIVTFRSGTKTVRLMQTLDIDKNDETTYSSTTRAKRFEVRARGTMKAGPLSVDQQQYIMAKVIQNSSLDQLMQHKAKGFFSSVRAAILQVCWMHISGSRVIKHEYLEDKPGLQEMQDLVRANWRDEWDNVNPFYDYHRDQQATSEDLMGTVGEDIFIVVDMNSKVIFANFEQLTQTLFDQDAANTLVRLLDLWAYFVAIPRIEAGRPSDIIYEYIRHELHPRLNPRKATVEQLPHARMGVAHYGCWAGKQDPHGRHIDRTMDSRFIRIQDRYEAQFAEQNFDKFGKAAFGTASALVRFLLRPLDPDLYEDYRDIWETLPQNKRMHTNDEDFASLFVLGVNHYTPRHRDLHDVQGGMAGMVTLGDYEGTGGSLCLPQLGLKVPCKSGTCTLLRSDALEHYVEDFDGDRFSLTCTNQERTKQHAWRRLGRLAPLTPWQEEETRVHPPLYVNENCDSLESYDWRDDE